MIEPVGSPFNGSEYNLICIVTVDDSVVDTNITISSQWMVPTDSDTIDDTISDSSENMMELIQQHNLTFRPLRGGDTGLYTCNATINQHDDEKFVVPANNSGEISVQVKGTAYCLYIFTSALDVRLTRNQLLLYLCVCAHFVLIALPLPGVNVTFRFSTETTEENYLILDFSDISKHLVCVADVISNLLYPPEIKITAGNIAINSTTGFSLMDYLSNSDTGEFTCTVCIAIPEADVVNYCSYKTVKVGKFIL